LNTKTAVRHDPKDNKLSVAWGILVGRLQCYELAKNFNMPQELIDELWNHYKNSLENYRTLKKE
jgi:hypothetical protein